MSSLQNLTALEIGYLTLPAGAADADRGAADRLDVAWLDAQPAFRQSELLRWLRFAEPLTVVLQGRQGTGVIAKPGVTVDDGNDEASVLRFPTPGS